MRAFSLQAEAIDPADDLGGFLVDQPVILILRVLPVAVDGVAGNRQSGPSFRLKSSLYLAGLISQIPLVHDVQEGGELVSVAVVAVNAVGDGNKMNPMLPEEHLGVKARLQIVAPDAGHILDDHRTDQPGFNISDQPLPVGAVEIAAAPSVVGIVDDIAVAVLLGIGLEVFLLVYNGVRFSRELIVAGQTLIERRDLFFRLSDCHQALLSD